MTLKEIINSDKDVLVPKDVAEVLRCDPYRIGLMAKQRPELLGFPVIVVGSRTKIPRIPFLRFMGVNE